MNTTTSLSQDQIDALRLLRDTGVIAQTYRVPRDAPNVKEVMSDLTIDGDGRWWRPGPEGVPVEVTDQVRAYVTEYGTPAADFNPSMLALVVKAIAEEEE